MGFFLIFNFCKKKNSFYVVIHIFGLILWCLREIHVVWWIKINISYFFWICRCFFAKIVVWERWCLSPLVTGWLSRSKAQLRAQFQLTTASDGWRVPHSCWRPSTLAYWHPFQIMVVIIWWQTIPFSPYQVTTITTRDAQTVTQIVSMSLFGKINVFSGFF